MTGSQKEMLVHILTFFPPDNMNLQAGDVVKTYGGSIGRLVENRSYNPDFPFAIRQVDDELKIYGETFFGMVNAGGFHANTKYGNFRDNVCTVIDTGA